MFKEQWYLGNYFFIYFIKYWKPRYLLNKALKMSPNKEIILITKQLLACYSSLNVFLITGVLGLSLDCRVIK